MTSPPVDPQPPLMVPYLTGVYLVTNGVADVYLVVDGPCCVFFRITQIEPNHDWLADLTRSSTFHRIVETDAHPDRIARGDAETLLYRLRQLEDVVDCRAILLTQMSVVSVTGRQYGPLLSRLDPPLQKPLIEIPEGSLVGDWIDGYANALAALASRLELAPAPPPEAGGGAAGDRRRVALVGLLHHRNEGDVTADQHELKRLLESLGLAVVSVWPGGDGVDALARAGHAETVLSLPYGRKAAATLAGRCGAELVELDLPLGLDATCAWLRRVAEATGTERRARELIDAELGRVVPRLEWVLAHELLQRRLAVAADRHLCGPLATALRELGCEVVLEATLTCHRSRDAATTDGASEARETEAAPRRLVGPTASELQHAIQRWRAAGRLDGAVINSLAVSALKRRTGLLPFVEVGFPSYYSHALHPQPTLGFAGVECLVSRLVNALRAPVDQAG